jgi:hypothetical protein
MNQYDGEQDAGLPGGVPEQQPCAGPACPVCAEANQMTSPCVHPAGHDGHHGCASGHSWEDYDVNAPRCFELCPTDSAWCIRDKGHAGVHWCGQHEY